VIGVALFAGLTAWNSRRLKNEDLYGVIDGGIAEASAIVGALSLYVDVVARFFTFYGYLVNATNEFGCATAWARRQVLLSWLRKQPGDLSQIVD